VTRIIGRDIDTMNARSTPVLLALCALALPFGPLHGQTRALPAFVDATANAGIHFRHHNGASANKWYPELFGGGVAVLDADSDGWPDLLFVDGRDWANGGRGATHTLYRNNRNGTFADVSAASGLPPLNVYGLGATVADYDNDGRDDVFMTTVDGGRLLHNDGQSRFSDVTRAAGLRNETFAVSAAWFDYDKDQRLDLYVGNYVEWSSASDRGCSQGGVKGYCGPNAYKATAPRLYRNLGGGRFDDVTAKVGLDRAADKAMGVAVLDYNGDGWLDLFVGSDRVPARLYRNDAGARFVDEAITAGVALSENGAARANMGTDAADYDRSGRPHIVVGNFLNEMLGLYHNDGGGRFRDVAPRSEVGRASLLNVTWGTFFFDADLDGFLDIFAANGGTDESQAMDSRATLSQAPLLLRNRGDGTFENISRQVGAAFQTPIMGRGAAALDYDGDGDVDLAMSTLGGPALLLRNDGGNRQRWLRVHLSGSTSNRSGMGAIVRVTSASGAQWQMVRSGSSYASQSELTLTFGLGRDTEAATVSVEWPSGTKQTFNKVASNQLLRIDEARGLQ
jgi:enediyne biosynthesis protein E4